MIESGMALLAIQLIRLVFYILPMEWTLVAGDFAIVINEMLNVIIKSVHSFVLLITFNQGITPTIILVRVSMKLSFDDPESFKEAVESLRFNNPPSDPNTSSMPPQPELGPQHQEKDEDTWKYDIQASKLLYNIHVYRDNDTIQLTSTWANWGWGSNTDSTVVASLLGSCSGFKLQVPWMI